MLHQREACVCSCVQVLAWCWEGKSGSGKQKGGVLAGLWELTWLQTIVIFLMVPHPCGLFLVLLIHEKVDMCFQAASSSSEWMLGFLLKADRHIVKAQVSTSDSTRGVFRDVLGRRSSCAEWDTVMLDGSVVCS